MAEHELDARLLSWLQRRCGGSPSRRMRAAGAVAAACEPLTADVISVRAAFRRLRVAGKLDYRPDLGGLPFEGYITVHAAAAHITGEDQRWREIVAEELCNAALRAALQDCGLLFSDWTKEELRTLARQLNALATAGSFPQERYTFGLSARALMGSSKILDRLPTVAREILGVARMPSTPRYIIAAGPSAPTSVLLVENSTTFDEAVRAGYAEDVTLVTAYGYGLNVGIAGASGWALVESLSQSGCGVLSLRGSGHTLSSLLTCPNVLYWGDLDREGLRIAYALRVRLPALKLSALYAPMIERLAQAGKAHPYTNATGKAGQREWDACGDPLVDALAQQCAASAVDQEAIDLTHHRELAAASLDASLAGISVSSSQPLGPCGSMP